MRRYTPAVSVEGGTGPQETPLALGLRIVEGVYGEADRLLDRGQRHAFRLFWFFLPETALLRQLRFQHLLMSRFLSDAGQQSLAYGALVAVVREGGSAFDAALVGSAALLPPAVLGLYGGAVADALPKRVALALAYNLQALLCLATPSLLGTDLHAMIFLLLAVNALGQVSGPTESSVLPYVATQAEIASAASLISLASTAGTAFGTALLAPILVHAFGVRPVIYLAGVLLLLAASRVFDLSAGDQKPPANAMAALRRDVRALDTVRWLAAQPAVATMIFVAVLAGTAQIVMQTLAPRFVQAVVRVDATNAVYVFAPSALGLLVALALTPALIRARGERGTALLGFVLVAASLFSLGMIRDLTAAIDAVNPLRALELVGADLAPGLRTASLLALPLGLGVALTATAVQTYINRRVPLAYQGRTFALQSALKNGTAIIPLTALGALASAFGVEAVLIASPFVLLGLAFGLIQLSRHFGGHAPRVNLDVMASFWSEPEAPDPTAAPP